MSFFTALRFLTAIPLPLKHSDSAEDMARSTVFFPVIGLIIGGILVGLNLLLGLFLPRAVVNVLLIVSLVLLTGAMHLDGFADTFDGMAGNKPVEDRWKIMHDSRNGAFGITGLVLVLLVEFVALNSIPAGLMVMSLLIMPVLSRWAMT
jgi:adenosylcobinamide-GDP ribazoletransferase